MSHWHFTDLFNNVCSGKNIHSISAFLTFFFGDRTAMLTTKYNKIQPKYGTVLHFIFLQLIRNRFSRMKKFQCTNNCSGALDCTENQYFYLLKSNENQPTIYILNNIINTI
jgi:hypothetical protein